MIRSSIASAQEDFEIEDFRVESDVLRDSPRVAVALGSCSCHSMAWVRSSMSCKQQHLALVSRPGWQTPCRQSNARCEGNDWVP